MTDIKIIDGLACPTAYCAISGKEINDLSLANAIWLEEWTPDGKFTQASPVRFVLKEADKHKDLSDKVLGGRSRSQKNCWVDMDVYLIQLQKNKGFDYSEAKRKAERLNGPPCPSEKAGPIDTPLFSQTNNHEIGGGEMTNTENTDQTITNTPPCIDEVVERDGGIMAASYPCGPDQNMSVTGIGGPAGQEGAIMEGKSGALPMDWGDIMECAEKGRARMDLIFRHDSEGNILNLHVDAGRPYPIELDRIQTPADLLGWTRHLCEKAWMDNVLLAELVDRVAKIKGWTKLIHRIY